MQTLINVIENIVVVWAVSLVVIGAASIVFGICEEAVSLYRYFNKKETLSIEDAVECELEPLEAWSMDDLPEVSRRDEIFSWYRMEDVLCWETEGLEEKIRQYVHLASISQYREKGQYMKNLDTLLEAYQLQLDD